MPIRPSLNSFLTNFVKESENLACHPPHALELVDVNHLQRQILNTEKAQRMAEFFSLLGD
ncbi:hypothetical protein ACE1CD_32665 [Aerosakkonema sp. BLCC-F183]|uniref:hypothetical protein n=1 Tax=Aerosakkonema sp. BLCC-F183 TaxID=3342834 RepID=UPI0035B7E684